MWLLFVILMAVHRMFFCCCIDLSLPLLLLKQRAAHNFMDSPLDLRAPGIELIFERIASRRPIARIALSEREGRLGERELAAAWAVHVWRLEERAGGHLLPACVDCGTPTGCFCDANDLSGVGCGRSLCDECDRDAGGLCRRCRRGGRPRFP